MNILLVDDNPTNLALLRHMVRKLQDCEPICYEHPLEALATCAETMPDMVLVDYMMPELDGIDFIQRFRALPHGRDIPIIMITADDSRDVRYEALQVGANDFLNKPIDKTEFLARMRNMLTLRKSQKQLANRAEWLASEVRKATRELRKRELEAVVMLSRAAEFRDPETGAHLLRMAHYAQVIARNLGLSQEQQDLLQEAAPMHDIGKVGVPDRILLKPGKLDRKEFEIMKQHAVYGYQILRDSASPLLRMGAEIAWTHHERVDGAGYPRGLKGDAIPLVGRIVAVADVFDALTSARPYKQAWPVDKAQDWLRTHAGAHFDPACVDAFLQSLDEVLAIRQRFQDVPGD
ncbi:MAG: response regulator [Zetaproteobacteria bacterium]|nr:MAG: response regulator [Zetaproteobacteria bacterium]